MSVKLKAKYIDSNHFYWYENVSIKNDVITYENISFKEEVVVSADNCLTYNGKIFK